LSERVLWSFEEIHIVLDNLSAHKTQAVGEFLEKNPRVRFHFTPTFSLAIHIVSSTFVAISVITGV
jgi:hypothetical protein